LNGISRYLIIDKTRKIHRGSILLCLPGQADTGLNRLIRVMGAQNSTAVERSAATKDEQRTNAGKKINNS
jgi:hypothetical protein